MKQPANSKGASVKKSVKRVGAKRDEGNYDAEAVALEAEQNYNKLNGSWQINDQFQQGKGSAPVSIDYFTCSSILIPHDWGAVSLHLPNYFARSIL